MTRLTRQKALAGEKRTRQTKNNPRKDPRKKKARPELLQPLLRRKIKSKTAEIQNFLSCRWNRQGKIEYLVTWKGFPGDYTTWIQEEILKRNIPNIFPMLKKFWEIYDLEARRDCVTKMRTCTHEEALGKSKRRGRKSRKKKKQSVNNYANGNHVETNEINTNGLPLKRLKRKPSLVHSYVTKMFEDAVPQTIRIMNRNFIPICTKPNIYLIERFLSIAECVTLLELSREKTFAKSFTESSEMKKVYSVYRTSFTTNFVKGATSFVRTIEQRAADIIGVSYQHVEALQVVRYCHQQKFALHHDCGEYFGERVDIVQPARLFTIFVYLNTIPRFAGGETAFPIAGLQVSPVQGNAIFFSNMNLETEKVLPEVAHRANTISVPGFTKFGLNIWVTNSPCP